MKKLLFILVLLVTVQTFSQERKNEVKLNLLNVIAFKWLDVSYQYNINEESSVGISFLTRFSDKNTQEYNRAYSVTPYYRYYLTNDAVSFFGEVHTKLNGGYYEKATDVYEKYSDLSIGLGGGLRYLSDKGFTGEIYAGAGRNMFTETAPEFVPRFGIALGYSF